MAFLLDSHHYFEPFTCLNKGCQFLLRSGNCIPLIWLLGTLPAFSFRSFWEHHRNDSIFCLSVTGVRWYQQKTAEISFPVWAMGRRQWHRHHFGGWGSDMCFRYNWPMVNLPGLFPNLMKTQLKLWVLQETQIGLGQAPKVWGTNWSLGTASDLAVKHQHGSLRLLKVYFQQLLSIVAAAVVLSWWDATYSLCQQSWSCCCRFMENKFTELHCNILLSWKLIRWNCTHSIRSPWQQPPSCSEVVKPFWTCQIEKSLAKHRKTAHAAICWSVTSDFCIRNLLWLSKIT